MKPLNLHWHRLANWGDAASPVIVESLSGRRVDWCALNSRTPHVVAIGSHLGQVGKHSHVWGTGILHARTKPNPAAHYHAVRGPISRAAVLAVGGECPPIYGDPAMFMASAFCPAGFTQGAGGPYEVGVILQRREKKYERQLIGAKPPPGMIHIDVEQPDLAAFVRDVASCGLIVSSSLHGIIVAHALHIPAIWWKPTDNPMGDGSKFADYLQGQELDPEPFKADRLTPRMISRAADRATFPRFDLAAFRAASPFEFKD